MVHAALRLPCARPTIKNHKETIDASKREAKGREGEKREKGGEEAWRREGRWRSKEREAERKGRGEEDERGEQSMQLKTKK